MKKVMSFVLALVLVMGMAVTAFAEEESSTSSPAAATSSENKTTALPVVEEEETVTAAPATLVVPGVEELPDGVKVVSIYAANTLEKEEKETFVAAQKALKESAPEGMIAKYFFFVKADKAAALTMKVGKVKDAVVKMFKDGKWVDVKATLKDGVLVIEEAVQGPVSVFTK